MPCIGVTMMSSMPLTFTRLDTMTIAPVVHAQLNNSDNENVGCVSFGHQVR